MTAAPVPGRRAHSALVLLVVTALASTGALPATADGGDGPTEKTAITTGEAGPDRAFEAFDASAVQLFDLDGDGSLELFANNDNNRVLVFDGATGRLLLEIETPHPNGWAARELNGIAVGDVNGNGIPDLVIANSASWVTALEVHPPAEPADAWVADELWQVFIDPTELDPDYWENRTELEEEWTGYAGLDGAAFLADVDGDGKDEVFFQTDDFPGQYALDDDGSLMWWHDWGDGNANPVVADVDADGRLEAVFATDGGKVFVYDAREGWAQCVFDSGEVDAEPGSISVAPQLVDVTGNGRLEIVVGARQAVENGNESWMDEQHATFMAIDHACEPVWARQYEWGNPHVYMRAAPVDVNGDGGVDLVFHDWNTIGHKPGNWEVTGRANLFAVDGRTGDVLWHSTTDTYWSNKDIAVADVLGGAEPEVLVVAQNGGQDGVTVKDSSGRTLGFLSAGKGWLVSRGPSVGDVDGDGLAEVVFPVHRNADGCPERDLDVGCREGAIRVFDTSRPVERAGALAAPWSGNHAFNGRVDFGGEPARAAGTDAGAAVVGAEPGVFAVRLPEETTHAFARAVRDDADGGWHALEHVGDGTWTAALAPVNGEEWVVRVTVPGPRIAHAAVTWQGEGPGRVTGSVDGRGLFETVTVHVDGADGASVENATVDDSGRFTFTLPPGDYRFRAVSGDGDEGDAVNVTVRPGEVHEQDIELRDSASTPGSLLAQAPGLLAGLGLAAFAGVAVAVHARRRRGP